MSRSILVRYKYTCSNGDTVFEWRDSEDGEPTQCIENSTHTVTNPRVVDRRDPKEYKVVEESTPTGGHFGVRTVTINAIKNTTTIKTVPPWKYPISALAVTFVSETAHTGDTIDLTIGEDTPIGILSGDAVAASMWASQNYRIGQAVLYDTGDSDYGTRVYTCIANTINNEIPTNTTYWQHGLGLSVSQTVIDNTAIGYYLKLDDGSNVNNVGEVLRVDKTNLQVYVDTNLVNSFTATPTIIKQTVYMFKDYEIGPTWEYTIGRSKIGGFYIPKDTKITIKYNNKSLINDKTFIGIVELLY